MRNKFIVYSLSLIVFVFVFVFTIYHIQYTIYAAESSPSADVKSKLEELKKEIASKAAKIKKEVDKKIRNKAYVGKVKTKSAQSLTLAASSGPKIVSMNQDTEYENQIKSKKKFSQKTISEEDFIVALGDIDETGVLTAKKVILLPTTNYQVPTHLWGQVIAISEGLVTVKNKVGKNIAVSLPSDSKVKLNEFVILTGHFGKNDIFDAEFVYIIPQGGILKPKVKLATPSAQTQPATQSGKNR